MKRFAAILLALVMVFTVVSVAACNHSKKVTVTLYPSENGTPVRRIHVVGTDDLTKYAGTNGDLEFAGWYYDKLLTDKFDPDNDKTTDGTCLYGKWDLPSQGGTTTPIDLSEVFDKYSNISKWNFAVNLTIIAGTDSDTEYFEYYGDKVLNTYTYDDEEYTEYFAYDDNGTAYWYYDNGDGTYDKYSEETTEFQEYFYMNLIYLEEISNYAFVESNGCYSAQNPSSAGNAIIAEYDDGSVWTSVTVYIENGNITKLIGVMNDGYTMTFVFSKYGQVSFTLPNATDSGSGNGGTTTPTEPTGTMDKQIYNSATFKNEILQDKLTTGTYGDPYIGLPSTSKEEYHVLVIPVQFSDTEIKKEQLDNLNLAFNDMEGQTGWESVKSYYYKSSYGNLNLAFDIAGVNMEGVPYYTSNKSSTYYAEQTEEYNGQKYTIGDNILLHEVLEYYEEILELDKYDTNDDGAIDAVYLIYSADIDYDQNKSDFYWAYVTWDDDGYDNNNPKLYDGVDPYYYLFAGLGFMDESVKGGYVTQYYPEIAGLKINASTYIHETGHLLGLDDYYDYQESLGCNEGLGGADMMDATVGDQNVFSKLMLGWLTPTIVTETKTITIKSSQEQGDAILIPLNFDNSYFCEYLLIDLYSAQGLNALHASMTNSYLYDGSTYAPYGVRIYHVTAWATDPYNNDYQSFNDYNNSSTDYALIKLVEADGEKKFASSDGWASYTDLWQKGDSLSKAFDGKYTTNAGKLLIFDITIDSVSADSATITISYNTAA